MLDTHMFYVRQVPDYQCDWVNGRLEKVQHQCACGGTNRPVPGGWLCDYCGDETVDETQYGRDFVNEGSEGWQERVAKHERELIVEGLNARLG